MKSLAVITILFSTLIASAQTKLQCDELQSKSRTSHERFLFTLDSANRITEMQDVIWNDVTDSISGSTSNSFQPTNENPALAFEREDGTLVYNYQTQDEGDIDFPGPLVDGMVVLSQDLVGDATVRISYDDGHQGLDIFELSCVTVDAK